MENYTVITGAIHMHTVDSDGSQTLEEVARIGNDVGLDYLLFSDHMSLNTLHEGKEGYYGKTLALIGYEHNDQDDNNHYLIFGLDKVLPATMKPVDYVRAAAEQGALGIMAHPDEIRDQFGLYRAYPWTAWEARGFDGVEIWNQMSEWMEQLRWYNRLAMIFMPRKSLQGPTDRVLRFWDEESQRRKVAGIAAVDAHGYPYRAGPLRLTIFPYKVQFKTLRTHLLLPREMSTDINEARRQVYDAIRDCRIFNSNYRWGDATGFSFTVSSAAVSAVCGGEVKLADDCLAKVKSPRKGNIRLIGNGRLIAETESDQLTAQISRPGVYRVEVHRKGRGWIFSNHIRVTDGPSGSGAETP
jgi:hypothetical protein